MTRHELKTRIERLEKGIPRRLDLRDLGYLNAFHAKFTAEDQAPPEMLRHYHRCVYILKHMPLRSQGSDTTAATQPPPPNEPPPATGGEFYRGLWINGKSSKPIPPIPPNPSTAPGLPTPSSAPAPRPSTKAGKR